MGLTIISGRAGSGKSRRIHERMGALEKAGMPSVLLVPEQYTLEAERALLRTAGTPGLLWAQVMSPSRLMTYVFSRVGGPRQALIDERGKAMALRRVAESCHGQLQVFGQVVRRPGFAAGMAGLLADLKSFDVTARRLSEISGGSELLDRKLRDVATLYREFDAFLEGRDFMDAEDRMAAFIDRLPEARELRGVPVFVDEFDYLPPRTIRMLSALLRLSGELTVSLMLGEPGDADAAVFEAGRQGLAALREMAGSAGQPVALEQTRRISGSATGRAAAIDHLERTLYAYPAPVFEGPADAVRLLEAATPEDEAESAAGRIAALVREKGLRWRDVAVVCGDLPEYGPRVARIFARHGIPFFLDNRRPVLHHPAVSCLLASLRALTRNCRMTDVLTLVKSGYAGVSEEDAEVLERYMTQYGVEGRAALEREWRRDDGRYDLAALNRARKAVAEPLAALSAAAGSRASAALWAEKLYAFITRLGMADRLRDEAEALRKRNMDGAAAESTQVLNAIMDMLDQVCGLLSDMAFTAGELADMLETGFAAAEVGVLPTGSDLVLVGDVGRTKTAAIRHLFVLGAAEGCLPVRYPEGAVFHDRDLARLSDAGLEVGRNAPVRTSQSRQGVYAAFAKPLDGLWLYWPLTDGAGGARQPSPLVSRVGRLLRLRPQAAPPPGHTTPAAAMRPLAAGFRALLAGWPPREDWAALAATLGAMPAWRPRLTAMMAQSRPDGEPPVGTGLMSPGSAAGVSQLEQYARCAFSWFVAYGLRPDEWKRYGMALSDAGTFVHAATADFGQKLLTLPDPARLTDGDAEALMNESVAAILGQSGGVVTDDGHGRWMASRLGAACRLAARRFAGQLRQGAFRPAAYEAGFGPGGAYPLIPGGAGVALRGFIDRVDVYSAPECDYLRVIDYKTGGVKLDLSGAMDGFQVQLWVYLKALCDGWRRTTGRPARPAGVFYFPVRDDYLTDRNDNLEALRMKAGRLDGLCVDEPRVLAAMDRELAEPGSRSAVIGVTTDKQGFPRGAVLPASDFEAISRGVMTTVEGMVRDMQAGRVAARPLRLGQATVCDWCPYRPVCGVFETARCRRPSPSRQVAAWIEKNREVEPHE